MARSEIRSAICPKDDSVNAKTTYSWRWFVFKELKINFRAGIRDNGKESLRLLLEGGAALLLQRKGWKGSCEVLDQDSYVTWIKYGLSCFPLGKTGSPLLSIRRSEQLLACVVWTRLWDNLKRYFLSLELYIAHHRLVHIYHHTRVQLIITTILNSSRCHPPLHSVPPSITTTIIPCSWLPLYSYNIQSTVSSIKLLSQHYSQPH